MPEITVLTESELRRSVSLDARAVDVVADAFSALAGEGVEMPPILRLDVPQNNGEVDVKTAYVPGLDGFAIKISPGFFDNPSRGLPSVTGLMVVLDAQTGLVRAVLLDNGYLTDVRTAAAGAVAARHLAPSDCAAAGVIGAGKQARLQMRALALVRPIRSVLVWDRDADLAAACVEELSDVLGVEAAVADGPEAVVRRSTAVVTATPAKVPHLEAAWLHPGLHITAMGSDAEDKNELDPAVLARADRLVCDRRRQCLRLGELHHAVAAGLLDADAPVTELGEITSGRASGRGGTDEITVCDLTGTGVQDTAIALHAYAEARNKGFGMTIYAGNTQP